MHSLHCIPLRLHTDTSCKAYQTNWMKCITKQLSTFHGVHYNAIVLHPVCGLECSGDHWRLKYTEVQMAFTRSPSLSNNPKNWFLQCVLYNAIILHPVCALAQCALQCRICRSAAAGPSKSGRPGRGLRPRHHHTAAQLAWNCQN